MCYYVNQSFILFPILFPGLVVVALAVSCASALYGPGDDVVELTPSNFHKLVVDSNDLWLVEFYAPW